MSNIKVIADRDDIVAIADAVRAKTNSSDEMTLSGIVDGINDIEGGTDTSDATATSSDILSGKSAYVKGEKIVGSINIVDVAQPEISIYSSGRIEASGYQEAGYTSGGVVSGEAYLSTVSGTTITPSTYTKTAISAGKYASGDIKVLGSSNLVSSNIKNGVSIFGVTGSYTGSSSTINTCTVDIYSGSSVLIGATTYSGSSFSPYSTNSSGTSINNVVCGSLISITCSFSSASISTSGVSRIQSTSSSSSSTYLFRVTASNGAYASINITQSA